MKSQASILEDYNTFEGAFDDQYVDAEEKEADLKTSVKPEASSDHCDGQYIPLPYKKPYSNGVKQKQVGWWIGRIESVHKDHFTAVLEDMKGITSVADFDKEELAPSDQNLLFPNTRFSYSVTQVDKRSGREYITKLSISGPAIWTENDAKKANEYREKVFPEELLDF